MKTDIAISVIVATYNPVWEKLKYTLSSILMQKDIALEIIVVDDGSKYDTSSLVKEYLRENHFEEYVLDYESENHGTCANIIRGINRARGKYIKLISPGDYLYSPDTLSNWFKFNQSNNAKISFGDAVYYNLKEGQKVNIINQKNAPTNLMIYKKECDLNVLKENCLLLHDFPIGAAFLVDAGLMREYCKIIQDRIKYAEDFIYRIMLADGIRIHYFSRLAVWYEYGEGISTNKEDKWTKIIKNDLDVATEIILERVKNNNWFSKRYKFYLSCDPKKQKIFKYVLFPRIIIWKLIDELKPSLTPHNVELHNYEQITKGDLVCK